MHSINNKPMCVGIKMKTIIKKVKPQEKDTLANLLEKYNYEFSQYDKRQFDNNGLFGYKYLNNYFTESSRYAYFIYVDDTLAGFALVNKYKVCERPIDWSIAEFFVSYNFVKSSFVIIVSGTLYPTPAILKGIVLFPIVCLILVFWGNKVIGQ